MKKFLSKKLTKKIIKILNYNGKIYFDKTKPNGTKRKFMSKAKINKIIKLKYNNFDLMLNKTIRHYQNLK